MEPEREREGDEERDAGTERQQEQATTARWSMRKKQQQRAGQRGEAIKNRGREQDRGREMRERGR